MDERTKKEREKPEPSGGWFRFFAACQEKLPEMEPNGVINLAKSQGYDLIGTRLRTVTLTPDRIGAVSLAAGMWEGV